MVRTPPRNQQPCPAGSYLSEDYCGCGLLGNKPYVRFIVTEGHSMRTEVCPQCGAGAVYRKIGGMWVTDVPGVRRRGALIPLCSQGAPAAAASEQEVTGGRLY